MANPKPFLSDEAWEKIEPFLPVKKPGRKGGRPGADNRAVMEGILWILKTGARWQDLPDRYPSPSTCWRRLKQWEEQGVWLDVWRAFLGELDDQGILDWEESFADGTFFPAKKGALESEKPSGARAQSAWWWSTVRVFRWEFSWIPHRRRRSRSSKKR